jgi:Na+/melibiose symporter-like transporter
VENGRLEAHIHDMASPEVDGPITFLVLAGTAAFMAAVVLGYFVHYGLGFSRQEIRTQAVIGAAIIGLLMATEYFGKKLRKPK